MTGLPAGMKLEIEFVAGTYTDITADSDMHITANFGRQSEFSQPQPAGFTVTLDNSTGKYTPQNASSPYYPNIQRRKRIRYSYNTGTQRLRFTGYIKSWQPMMENGVRPVMAITAACRMDQLSRVKMLSPIREEITRDDPSVWWPMTDDQDQVTAAEQSGNGGPPLAPAGVGATAPVFGDNGPGVGDGTGVKFSATGRFLTANVANLLIPVSAQKFCFEFWAQTSSATDQTPLFMADTAGSMTLSVTIAGASTGRPAFNLSGTGAITGSTTVVDGGWHHYAITYDGSGTWTFYLDGTSVGTLSGGHAALNLVTVGQMTGNMGQLACYSSATTIPDLTRIQEHQRAGVGFVNNTTELRIARFLSYAFGVSYTSVLASENLDSGQIAFNTYPQDGKDVLSACQDMAVSEGGGAVIYVTPDGKVRFANRRYRDDRTPMLTIDVPRDLDPSVYQPSLDDANLITQVTANRASSSETQTSQTYSSGATDVFADNVTTYTMGTPDGAVTGDGDALNLAQYMVNAQSVQALRFPQIAVDLATAENNLYDAVGQLQIGDRIRLTNIPSNAYPVSTLDFFLEGWTEMATVDSYKFVMDVSAADLPGKRWQWDVSTWDGGDVWAL